METSLACSDIISYQGPYSTLLPVFSTGSVTLVPSDFEDCLHSDELPAVNIHLPVLNSRCFIALTFLSSHLPVHYFQFLVWPDVLVSCPQAP